MEMKNEIKIDEVNSHFSEIASKYRNLRKTDLEPILHIRNQLDEKPGISIADVGCGDGRYSLELLKSLGDECYLHCIDSNENMLQYLKEYMKENNVMNFCVRPGASLWQMPSPASTSRTSWGTWRWTCAMARCGFAWPWPVTATLARR